MKTSKWSGTTPLDSTTGLPVVPDGYIWRVSAPAHAASDYYMVELCKQTQHKWLGISKTVLTVIGSHPVRRSEIGATAIREAAAYALQYNKILRHFERLEPIRTDLLGEYPPKKLGSASND